MYFEQSRGAVGATGHQPLSFSLTRDREIKLTDISAFIGRNH